MMGRGWFAGLVALLMLAGLVLAGVYVYNLGVGEGLARGAAVEVPEGSALPAPYYGPYFYPRPFGFGLVGCLVPLLFFFFAFALLRGLFWRGRWGWGGPYGRGGWKGHKGMPPFFEEWHRRAHESPEDGEPTANL